MWWRIKAHRTSWAAAFCILRQAGPTITCDFLTVEAWEDTMDAVNCLQAFAAALLLSRLVLVQGIVCIRSWWFTIVKFPFLILTYTATVVSGHPDDVIVEPNAWANFSCAVHCSYPVKWYKAGHVYPISHYTDSRSIAGLEFRIPANSTCTSENKITYFLQVFATKTFNNSAFYCGAYETCYDCPETECRCGCVGYCYSRPAFLRGKPACILMFLLNDDCISFLYGSIT